MTDLPAGVDQGALDAAATEPIEGPNPTPGEASAPEPEAVSAPEPETVESADYSGWLKADLVAEAESRGLDTSGTKDELIARLTAAE
jgi:hypothetical protein